MTILQTEVSTRLENPLRPTFSPVATGHEGWEDLIAQIEASDDFRAHSDMEKRHLFTAHDRIASSLSFDPASVTPSQLQAWAWVCAIDVFEQIALSHALHFLVFQAIATGQRDPAQPFEFSDLPHPALQH